MMHKARSCSVSFLTRIVLGLTLLAQFSMGSAAPVDTGFADVSPDSYAAPYIKAIKDAGITSGCGNGNYCPGLPVTRETMAVMIVRAIEGEPAADACNGANPFADVAAARWSCPHIKRMAELGITAGCGNGSFCPTQNVTREQMAAFLVRALEGNPSGGYCGATMPFSDVAVGSTFCGHIKRLQELAVTTGCGGSNYCPSQVVNREQMAIFLTRAFLGVTTARFSASDADLPNPDRGFYDWSGSDFINDFSQDSVQSSFASGKRLVFAPVSLASYRGSDLPDAFLTALNARFASVRAAGMKVTPLFAYDFTAGGNDATAAWIKRHLEQLKPVLAANADVIPYMRAGFIGAWGEWHSSQSGNSCGYHSGTTPCATADANRIIVRDALLANVPGTTQIGFRYPPDLQKWYPTVADVPAQVGMHNDCFLSGPTDTGTYEDSTQRTYVQSLTINGAFGGETCDGETPIRDTCADILTEGRLYHLAWLNAEGATTALNSWHTAGCYSQVSANMGYRLQLDAISHKATAPRGASIDFHVDLRNVGWARMFVARKLVITLRHKTSGVTLSASAGDLSALAAQAGGSTRITVTLPIPSGAEVGDYSVSASAPDIFSATAADPRFSVRFANADTPSLGQVWDDATARFNVGTSLSIR